MTLHNLILAAIVVMFAMFVVTLFSVQIYVLFDSRKAKRVVAGQSVHQAERS